VHQTHDTRQKSLLWQTNGLTMHGYGCGFGKDGFYFEGEFQNNMLNGFGGWLYPNGDQYTGSF